MSTYWLMNQHDGDGPTALVDTDGRLRITTVLRFGPAITELDEQQEIWDRVVGHVAPTMKPLVRASSLDEPGTAPHDELRRDGPGDGRSARRARRHGGSAEGSGARRGARGPDRSRNRGDR